MKNGYRGNILHRAQYFVMRDGWSDYCIFAFQTLPFAFEPMCAETTRKIMLEICANGLQSAIHARDGGADRIELCENLPLGGTTPSHGTIVLGRQQLDIPIHVLVRPRPGNFCYSWEEKEVLLEDIRFCRDQGVSGVVVGALTPDNKIDTSFCRDMIGVARPLSVTFHRAFDFTDHPFEAMEALISLGFNRILTSGQKPSALEGKILIRELHQAAAGRIILLPGGGINEDNILELIRFTGVNEVHLSAGKYIPGTNYSTDTPVSLTMATSGEEGIFVTDTERVKRVVDVLMC